MEIKMKSTSLFDGIYILTNITGVYYSEKDEADFIKKDLYSKLEYLKDKVPRSYKIRLASGEVYYTPGLGEMIISHYDGFIEKFDKPDFAGINAKMIYTKLLSELHNSRCFSAKMAKISKTYKVKNPKKWRY
jgi:hypothetical protein